DAAIGKAAHVIFDAGQLPAQAAAGVEAGKVLASEAAHPAGDQRQRIADGQHRGGAGTGSEPERTGFLERPQVDDDARSAGELTARLAGDGNQRSADLSD